MQGYVSWFQSLIPSIHITLGIHIIFMVKIENLSAQVTVWYAGDHRFGTSLMIVLEKLDLSLDSKRKLRNNSTISIWNRVNVIFPLRCNLLALSMSWYLFTEYCFLQSVMSYKILSCPFGIIDVSNWSCPVSVISFYFIYFFVIVLKLYAPKVPKRKS